LGRGWIGKFETIHFYGDSGNMRGNAPIQGEFGGGGRGILHVKAVLLLWVDQDTTKKPKGEK